MKKTIFLLLLLALTLACATASASIDIVGKEVVYSYSFDGSYPGVYFFADVVNNGVADVSLSSDSSFTIHDEDGQVLDEEYIRMVPVTLAPGESGVVFAKLMSSLPNSSYIKSYQYSLEASYPWDYTPLPATHMKDSNDVYVRLTNDGPDTLWDAYAFLIARDEKGSPVYVDVTIAYRVGIPAGEALEYPMFLTHDLERFLTDNGLAPVDFTVGGYIY
ncbi:MAG: hypothetical protein J6K72_06295 [Clostridia bacterium]|nr:hypothetical protein [Clostridia bacterium]